jgi:signal peptidase I
MTGANHGRSVAGCQLVADVVYRFGHVCLKVTGSSMMPAIWPGDVITVQRCNLSQLQIGQVVLYKRGDGLVAHRISAIQDGMFIMRGDSLKNIDPPIDASAIVGLVIPADRDGNYRNPQQHLQQRIGSFILRRSDLVLRAVLFLRRCLFSSAIRDIR